MRLLLSFITLLTVNTQAALWYLDSAAIGANNGTSYAAMAVANDFSLLSDDTIAKDTGIDLSLWCSNDLIDVSRPQGITFDRGAYEYIGGIEIPPIEVPPIVSYEIRGYGL